jgi:hypothetical protein
MRWVKVADRWSSADLSEREILDDELLRRVPSLSNADFVVENTETGERTFSSACFKLRPDEDGLSMFSRTVMERNGLTCADVCCDPLNAVVSIPGSEPNDQGLTTVPDPWPTDVPQPEHLRNAAHMLIKGIDALTKGPRSALARKWAREAILVHSPFEAENSG